MKTLRILTAAIFAIVVLISCEEEVTTTNSLETSEIRNSIENYSNVFDTLSTENYNIDAVTNFKSALENAEISLEKAITQAEIDKALSDLNIAYTNLINSRKVVEVEKPIVTPIDTTTPSDTTKPIVVEDTLKNLTPAQKATVLIFNKYVNKLVTNNNFTMTFTSYSYTTGKLETTNGEATGLCLDSSAEYTIDSEGYLTFRNGTYRWKVEELTGTNFGNGNMIRFEQEKSGESIKIYEVI